MATFPKSVQNLQQRGKENITSVQKHICYSHSRMLTLVKCNSTGAYFQAKKIP